MVSLGKPGQRLWNAVWAKPMDEYIKEQLGKSASELPRSLRENGLWNRFLPNEPVKEPLKVAENWTTTEVEGVTPKVALYETSNIDGKRYQMRKRKLKAEAYNRVYSEMVTAGITLSFTEFADIGWGIINVRTSRGRRKWPHTHRIYE